MSYSDHDPLGIVGELTIGTRGPEGPGEVIVPIRGGRETFIAYSDAPLAAGESVLVVESRPGRVVTVVPWEKFERPIG